MAQRPIFLSNKDKCLGVETKIIEFQWYPGMSASQKKKSINSLHQKAREKGIPSILEISSKSEDELGINLSAFNLCFTTIKYKNTFSVETAFQSSKVFERGGPYTDLLDKSSREAKTDERIRSSGSLVAFKFFGETFPIKPRTFFYDWLYINALNKNPVLAEKIVSYTAFSDIEFNPEKSINCQAYSAALYVSLHSTSLLREALKSSKDFLQILKSVYAKKDHDRFLQINLI